MVLTASNPLVYFQSLKIIFGPSDTWLMRPVTQHIVLKIVGFQEGQQSFHSHLKHFEVKVSKFNLKTDLNNLIRLK